MTLQISYPHLETPAGESPRLRRLPRIRVVHIVMDYLAHGWSVEEICRQHPHLLPAEVHAAMAYYFDHQDQLDAEIRSEWEQLSQDRAVAPDSPFVARMKAKGQM
ncbi:MAG: hypothetical protein QOE14_664 [Humisphaera sp.]|nr:hypothetical protein [Humisphaera sp.]